MTATNIRLKSWFIAEHTKLYDNTPFYQAHGYIYGHPKLANGKHIHTSEITDITFLPDDNCITVHTQSGHTYTLFLHDISQESYEITQLCLHKFHIPVLPIDIDHAAREAKSAGKDKSSDKIPESHELYLEISGITTLTARYCHSNGAITDIPVSQHIGMYQNSCIISDEEHGTVDFRYYDKQNMYDGAYDGIEPYSWSDDISAVLIKNTGTGNIIFLYGEYPVCRPGETICIRR